MSRRLSPVLPAIGVIVAVLLTGCSGGAPTTTADPPATVAPPATPAPSTAVAPTTEPTTAAATSAPVAGSCEPSADSGTVAVRIEGSAFSPGRIRAEVGQVIAFTNRDPIPHTATLDDGTCTTPNLGNGASGGLVFSAPGQFPFHCRIHPDMAGTIDISG